MTRYKTLWIGIVLLTLLTGCWDETEIGEYGYATAIGVDYKDDHYILYVQLLDFSNVAKQSDQKVSETASLFVGKSSGRTFYEAVNHMYKTSQQPLHWGQIGSIVYSESVLEKGVEKIQQSIKRNGEFRYTPWVFGTKDSIEDIFSVSGFFHLPPIYTILYQPLDTYKVYSYIQPLRMYEFISMNNEPGGTAVLPSIAINESAWLEANTDDKAKNTLHINGGFQMTEGQYQDFMSLEDLIGLRWIEEETNITPVNISHEGMEIGIVEILNPSSRIRQEGEGDETTFNIRIEAKGLLADLQKDMSQDQIESFVKKQIKEDIKTTYGKGLENNIDVYNFKNKLFRNGMEPEKAKAFQLTENTLNHITVDFFLESEGVFDRDE